MNEKDTQTHELTEVEGPEDVYRIHPGAGLYDLHNAMDQRLTQARGITSALIAHSDPMLSNAMWAADDLLTQAEDPAKRFWELYAKQKHSQD